MSIDCNACREYNDLTRRSFLKAGGLALLAAGVPAWLPRVVFSKSFVAGRDVIVYVYLRGGADGLTMIAPYGDPAYATIRPTLRLLPPGGGANSALALANSNFFGLAPGMGALLEPYEAGKLAIVHASGFVVGNPSRSHFDAQRFMEVGKFNDPTLFTGWLGRHLSDTGAVMPAQPVRAIGVATGLQQSLVGSPKSIPVPGLGGSTSPAYNITGSSSTAAARLARLNTMYSAVADPVKTAAQTTQATITLLNSIGFSTYQPAGGAAYPTSSFGYAMKSAAALIKADIGVEALAIDKGGWDLHANLGPVTGSMNTLMDDLARAMQAFHRDVIAGSNKNVVVVVMSEFGRRAAENGSAGVDHGFGNAMLLMGQSINGGQVFSRNTQGQAGWPGLGPGQLFQNLDLAATIDFRTVLSEVCQNLLQNTNLSNVFPSFVQQPFIGITDV
jgi:uncharacterized protein (DUF1501 family)